MNSKITAALGLILCSSLCFGAGNMFIPTIADQTICENSACLVLPIEAPEAGIFMSNLTKKQSESLLLQSDILPYENLERQLDSNGSVANNFLQLQLVYDQRLQLVSKLQESQEIYQNLQQTRRLAEIKKKLTVSSKK